MEILELPQERPAASAKPFDFTGLSNVLFESADLLEEARDSDDQKFKDAAIELAVRSLYTASTAIDLYVQTQRKPATTAAAILAGPWTTAKPRGKRAPALTS
jgi:hypothetical protein